MTAKDVWIADIIQRPAIRERTSRSARFSDSRSKRSASSAPRPIVLPSRMPLTDSDSCTSEEMSAIAPCLTVVILRRCAPTRRASSTKNGSSASENSASRQSSSSIATTEAITVVTLETIDAAVARHDGLHAADVVGDARLDLARAGAREERQREPLQVPVDLRAQVVHHPLADDVGQPRLPDAEDRGDDRDADHPGDEHDQQLVVVLRDRDVEDVAQQERRDHPQDRAETRSAPGR